MIYLDLLQIAIAIVLVVDVSGFGQDVKWAIARWLNTSVDRIHEKPFFCSKCLTTWIGLGYATIVGELSLSVIIYTLLLGVATPIIDNIISLTIEAIRTALDKIFDRLC